MSTSTQAFDVCVQISKRYSLLAPRPVKSLLQSVTKVSKAPSDSDKVVFKALPQTLNVRKDRKAMESDGKRGSGSA